MRAGLQIPEFSIPDMKLAPIAVLPLRTRDNLDVRGRFKLAYAPHHFTKNRDLLVKLILVRGMLIMTAAANPEVRTAGFDALRSCLLHLEEPRMQLVLLLYGRLLTGKNERSEHYSSIDAGKTVASVYQLFDCYEVGHCTMGFVRPS